jgi:biotin synthase
MKLRVSAGSAIALGLMSGPLDVAPCITYLMLPGTCEAECSYCTWGRDDYLSRVRWPEFDIGLLKGVRRYCLQTVEREGMENEMDEVLGSLEGEGDVAIAYLTQERAEILYKHGVRSVGIGLDACTRALYEKHKPGLSWERAMDSFGYDFSFFCHVIIGLGESDEDFLTMSQRMHDQGTRLALFAYTPVKGKRPVGGVSVERYRALQLASYLIEHGTPVEDFGIEGGRLVDIPRGFDERAFLTRGCENCNRPFYNERAGREPYNFPAERFGSYDIEGEIRRYLRP